MRYYWQSSFQYCSSLWEPRWLKVQLFVTVDTIVLVRSFILPLNERIVVVKMSSIVLKITVVRHFAYGVPLSFLIHKLKQQIIII